MTSYFNPTTFSPQLIQHKYAYFNI